MICNVPLMHSQFWAAVCFRTAGFKVYTLHALQAIKGLKGLLKTPKKTEVFTPTPSSKNPFESILLKSACPPISLQLSPCSPCCAYWQRKLRRWRRCGNTRSQHHLHCHHPHPVPPETCRTTDRDLVFNAQSTAEPYWQIHFPMVRISLQEPQTLTCFQMETTRFVKVVNVLNIFCILGLAGIVYECYGHHWVHY